MSGLSRPISAGVAERIAARLEALGQVVRVRLIDTLERSGELSVSELAQRVGVSVYDASQHLSVLHREGIVERRRHAQFVRYRLVDPTVLVIYEQVADRIRQQIEDARRQFGQ